MSFSELSICALRSSFLLTRGESTPFCPNQLHAPQRYFIKLRVTFQRRLVFQLIDFDCSIKDFQLLKPFLKNFSKGFQHLLLSHYTEIVTVTQTFEFSVVVKEESWARRSAFHGTIFQDFRPSVFPNGRRISMLLQSLASLPFCSCPSGKCVNPPASFTVEVRSPHVPCCHPLQFEWFATVVVTLFLVDNFEYTHLPHVLHLFFPSFHQQPRINPRAVDSPIFPRVVWCYHLHPAPDLQSAILQPSEIICRLIALSIATTTDAGHSHAVSDFPLL